MITPLGQEPRFIPATEEHALKLAALHEKRVAAALENVKADARRNADDGEFVKGMRALGASKQ